MLALQCTVDVNEQVLIPDPGFLGYTPSVELTDAVPVPFMLHEKNKWEIDPDDIRKAADKKKSHALIINSPANPTGNVLSRKTLEEIADIAIEYDIYVFSDEAYEKIIYGKKQKHRMNHCKYFSMPKENARPLTQKGFMKFFNRLK